MIMVNTKQYCPNDTNTWTINPTMDGYICVRKKKDIDIYRYKNQVIKNKMNNINDVYILYFQ